LSDVDGFNYIDNGAQRNLDAIVRYENHDLDSLSKSSLIKNVNSNSINQGK